MRLSKTFRLRILCVHQGGELYGSDRSFLQAVEALKTGWPEAWVRVVLAVDGPLRPMLELVADEVVVRDLAVLRLANPWATLAKTTVALPWYLAAAASDIMRSDLTYINTTVIADYTIVSRIFSSKTVIHAREIPKSKLMPFIRGLLRASGSRIIFNSAATKQAFSLHPKQSSTVIHNGISVVPNNKLPELPETFNAARPLRLAMLGRISDWKGQDLLIEALEMLAPADRVRVRVRIVGSTFRDVHGPIIALQSQIAAAGLTDIVTLESFRDNPSEVYAWSDLCVVPSRLPEPFGRVAVEAMAHARPVIAASHGGLVEIVEDGSSGWLVMPNDPVELAKSIRAALSDPSEVRRRGLAAHSRFDSEFSATKMSSRLRDVLQDWVPALRKN